MELSKVVMGRAWKRLAAALLGLAAGALVPAAASAAVLSVPCSQFHIDGSTFLRSVIEQANASGAQNTIELASDCTYTLTAVDNNWYGPTGLPPIASAITIHGNGATIQRDPTAPPFRFFFIGADPNDVNTDNYTTPGPGALTLEDLTLKGGLAKGGDSNFGGGGAGLGGAIFSQGQLLLERVTLADNAAQGGSSGTPLACNQPNGCDQLAGGGLGSDALYDPASYDLGNQGGGFGGAWPPGTGSSGGANAPGYTGGGGGGFRGSEDGGTPNGGGPVSGLGGNSPQGGIGGDGSGAGATHQGSNGDGHGGGFGFGGDLSGGGGGVGGGGGGGVFGFGAGGGFGGGGGGGAGGGGFGGGGGGDGDGAGGFGGGSGTVIGGQPGGGGAGMGGAVFNMQGDLAVVNSTFSDNRAVRGTGTQPGAGVGGAIANLNGAVTIDSSTLAFNTADQGGGALVDFGYDGARARQAHVVIRRSILSDTLDGGTGGPGPDLAANAPRHVTGGLGNRSSATVVVSDHDLVQSMLALGSASIHGTPISDTSFLGPLQDNGGLTPTRAPNIVSIAVEGGGSGCPPTDQRRIRRPQGAACDIGAVELGNPYLPSEFTLPGNMIGASLIAHQSGTATLTATTPTAGLASRGCRPGQTRIHGRCKPRLTIIATGRTTGRAGRKLTIRATLTHQAKQALASGETLHVTAILTYTPAHSKHTITLTRHLTLKRR